MHRSTHSLKTGGHRKWSVKVGDVEQEIDNMNFRLQTDHSVNNNLISAYLHAHTVYSLNTIMSTCFAVDKQHLKH